MFKRIKNYVQVTRHLKVWLDRWLNTKNWRPLFKIYNKTKKAVSTELKGTKPTFMFHAVQNIFLSEYTSYSYIMLTL